MNTTNQLPTSSEDLSLCLGEHALDWPEYWTDTELGIEGTKFSLMDEGCASALGQQELSMKRDQRHDLHQISRGFGVASVQLPESACAKFQVGEVGGGEGAGLGRVTWSVQDFGGGVVFWEGGVRG